MALTQGSRAMSEARDLSLMRIFLRYRWSHNTGRAGRIYNAAWLPYSGQCPRFDHGGGK